MLSDLPSGTAQALFAPWLSTLTDADAQQALAQHSQRLTAWNDADAAEQAGADPVKATLVDLAQRWLLALHQLWQSRPPSSRKASQELDRQARQLDTALSAADFSLALRTHCETAFRHLLWEHPRTQPQVRPLFGNKARLLAEPSLAELDPFDEAAVLRHLSTLATTPEVRHAQQQTIAAALRTLGHFTSKPTHTSAAPVGIVLGCGQSGIGPYLTAGLVLERHGKLRLDQSVNDNSGQVGACLRALNDDDPTTDTSSAQQIRAAADALFADGHEYGTDTIDPRLRQILLPAPNGRYRAITPLTSMGLSAHLHSHWQGKNSHAKQVFYGFSATAINNFSVLRQVPHADSSKPMVSDLPNRTLLFEVPQRRWAQVTLARICHLGYRPSPNAAIDNQVFDQYRQHDQQLRADSVRAMQIEQRILARPLRLLWADVLRRRAECSEALDELDAAARDALLAGVDAKPATVRFLLLGMEGEHERGVSPRALARHLAVLSFQHLKRLKDKHGERTLGLGLLDQQRFMRWAPAHIARLLSRR